MSKGESSNLKPLPPNLNKLKGSYTLDSRLREKIHITSNILTGSVKTWRNIKKVVDDYFRHSDIWEEQPQQFVSILRISLRAINIIISKQPAQNTSTTELLLQQYCSSLATYYNHPKIINDVISYYQKKELERRDECNLQQTHIQSNATASAMVLEKSRLMEKSSKKRAFEYIEDEDDHLVLSDGNSNASGTKDAGEEGEFNNDDIV